ncbi:MAG: DUF2723 domain-containing protein [Thermotogae bacterium]|nr:DUF2723 domain-containing protein [Thermotogota bacterium]
MVKRRVLYGNALRVLVLIILGVAYISLLSPYPTGPGDTSKFQFLSNVWGTAHSPGYPLYVVVLHFWSFVVPFGTPAFKSNFLQVVLALAALNMMWSTGRRMGVSKIPMAVSVLIGGGTSIFLRFGTLTEAYMFSVFMGMLGMYLLVVHRRPLISWAALSFGLSHHPLGVVFMLTYFLLCRGKFGFRLKTFLYMFMILLLAYLPYLLVIAWTVSDYALYVESRAHNLEELLHVITGRRFGSYMDLLNLHKNLLWLSKGIKSFLKNYLLLIPLLTYALIRFRSLKVSVLPFLSSLILLFVIVSLYHIPDIADYLVVALPFNVLVGAVALDDLKDRRWVTLLFALAALLQVLYVSTKEFRWKVRLETAEREYRRTVYGLRNVALIPRNSYNHRQHMLYYVLGEGLVLSNQVYPIYYFDPTGIKSYLCGSFPYPVEQNRLLLKRANPPAGLRVVTYGRDYTKELEKVGCQHKRIGDKPLYEVSCECGER